MKRIWIASLAIAIACSTAALAQTQTQNSSNGTTGKTSQRNTSSAEGLQRKGGKDVGTRGSQKMEEGVSRSGNSNLSPTSPSNAPGPGTNSKSNMNASGGNAAKNATTGGEGSSVKEPKKSTMPVQKPVKSGSGTRNGNVGNAGTKPVQTQGSTSDGTASVPSSGGAPGTRTKETRSVQPKSRAASMPSTDPNLQPASAGGQANSAKKTGANGAPSSGNSNNSLTPRGQKEGSYSDAAKRNRTPEGPSKDPLKTGPNGQQTKN